LISKHTPDSCRLLDNKDAEELNQKLAKLLWKSKEKVKKGDKPEKEDKNISIHNKKELPSLFGQIYNTVFSYNTCKSSQILRSAQLAAVSQA
jgi:phosphoribosylaminoimidazole-succinocarboxamide synthase